MRKKYIMMVILPLCILLICFSNPSEEEHESKVNNECVVKECNLYELVQAKYHNYLLFSYSTSDVTGNNEVVSIGLAGLIIITKDFSIIRTPQIY